MNETDPVFARSRPTRVLLSTVVFAVLIGGCAGLKRCAYEGFGRDGWQQPDRVIQALGIEPGDRVADLGAGGGYFTFRLAQAVGSDGKVYAVDVDPGMTDYLRERASKGGYANVDAVLAEYDDPLLPEGGVELIFTCNTYHHIDDRTAYFARASRYLSPKGRIAVIEYKSEGWLQTLFSHSTGSKTIRSEMEEGGYRLLQELDFLSRQHFLVFARAGD
jgi:ubiquinone/menaquinone biosynthesis C-methylase UbiE